MRGLRLRDARLAGETIQQVLCLVSPIDHHLTHELDRGGVGRVEEKHGRRRAGVELAVSVPCEHVAHGDRHVAEVDVHRARVGAFVANRAVVGHVRELVEVAQADTAARLFLVQEGLDQQRCGEDLVARAVQQVGARHVRRAHWLALAAAQAVLDRIGDASDRALLEDQALVADQRETRRVRPRQIGG